MSFLVTFFVALTLILVVSGAAAMLVVRYLDIDTFEPPDGRDRDS